MRCTSTSTVLGLFAVATSFFSSLAAAAASDYDEAYCSTQNVASDTDKFYWQWQSESKCTEHCQGYAYSIIKYTDCWCSNYAPNTQTDITECAVDCPGYPSEHCGDRSKNLFIYLANGPIPSGTQDASQPSSTVPSSTTQAQTSALDSPTHNDPFPTPTLVTESGQVVTRTVMFTPTSAPSQTGKDDDGSNTGAIIGGAIGGVLGILAIVGGILYFLWRRRKEQKKDQEAGANNSPAGISRNVSTMSKAGLLGSFQEKDPQYPSPIATQFGSQRSRYDGDTISPMTPSDRRLSQPILVDSRLNPRAVLAFHDNGSRESVGTIDESRDWGRQLNVRNPDLTHRD